VGCRKRWKDRHWRLAGPVVKCAAKFAAKAGPASGASFGAWFGAALIVGAAALAASGCGASSPAQRALGALGTRAASGATPAVTEAQARQAFDHYVAVWNSSTRQGHAQNALPVLAGVEHDVLAAFLGSRQIFAVQGWGTQSSSAASSSAYSSSLSISLGAPPAYTYSRPTFLLPEQAGYPKFFVAYTTRTADGRSPATDRVTSVGGLRVPAHGPVLMLFSQARAGAQWKLASTSRLPGGARPPALAKDAGGYVPQVPLSAAGLLIRPGYAGALQAAVVAEGPANPAGRAVAAGPLTTGLYQAARGKLGLRVPAGDVYQWMLQGSALPAFALRTANGGALVFYTMTLNTTVAVPDVINKADPIRHGPAIQVPAGLLPLIPSGQPTAPREQLTSQQTLSFAAVDPPAGNGTLQVIAIGGGLTAAAAS
jgi:hypothetical protein